MLRIQLSINQTGNGDPPPKDKPRDDEPLRGVPPVETDEAEDEKSSKK